MKVKFTIIIIIYTVLSVVVGCAFALFACLDLYERTDVLSMKEMVQSIVGGVQTATNVLIQRGGMGAKQIGNAFKNDFSVLNDTDKTEEILAKYVYTVMGSTVDAAGLYDFKFMPMHLFMMWDENWTERLVYYRPCKDNSNRKQCELMSRESPFVDYKNGDYRMARKDEVPKIFRNLTNFKTTKCPAYGDCVGIADIPNDQGGPMMYFLSRIPFHVDVIPVPLRGWHMLWASNMLFFDQIAANRTGLCVSGYSSTESDLPTKEAKEYAKKKASGQLINPHDSYYNNTIFSATFFQDTDEVTMQQQFYSSSWYDVSDREFCDDSYDHGPAKPRSKSSVYLAYSYFDFNKGELVNDSYMIRLDYHNPISQRSFTPFHAAIVSTSTAWLLTVCILVIYFICSFLVPLEKMRKMRSDLIKTSLAGLDDDGTLAKEIFGSMVDDNALIDANGDEIRVMLTLQERLDEFYTGLIQTRSDELAHIKAHYYRRFNALKVMNYFMRREDDDLHQSLPGLLDSKEVNRHFHLGNVAGNAGTFMQSFSNARHVFRQFKTILSNELAIEFFKTFCVKRGRSTVNSLFFVMDVSWLNQVEEGAKKGTDDFLSSLFADNPASQSGGPPSELGSPAMTRRRPDGLVVSVSSTSDPCLSSSHGDLASPRGEPMSPRENRPRRSHFAKSKDEDDSKKKIPVSGNQQQNSEPSKKQSSAASLISEDSDLSTSGQSFKQQPAHAAFASTNGESIARFIHEAYFGRKSLAQRDLKHAALLGCSQIPEYLTLRDSGDALVFTPTMFNTVLAAVIKKISNDVIPQFIESASFQVMVYCLILTNYFNKSDKGKRQRAIDDEVVAKKTNALVNGVWEACHDDNKKKDEDEDIDDDSSSSDNSGGDDDDDDDDPEKPLKNEKSGDAEQ